MCNEKPEIIYDFYGFLQELYELKYPCPGSPRDARLLEWNPKPIQYHYDIASELAFLRDKGILIIGSGNIVHNLGLIDFRNIDAAPYSWAIDFDEEVKSNLMNMDHTKLIDLNRYTPQLCCGWDKAFQLQPHRSTES